MAAPAFTGEYVSGPHDLPGAAMVGRYIDLLAIRCPLPIYVWGRPNPGERSVYWLPELEPPSLRSFSSAT